MSVETMAIVLHHSNASGTNKVVMLGIANHDGDGGAWPAVATLARYANVSARSVQRALSELVAAGEIRVSYQDGGTRGTRDDRRPNRYDVLVTCPSSCDRSPQHRTRGDADVTPSDSRSRGDIPDARGDIPDANGVTPVSPEPSLEPPRNHPSRADFLTSPSPKVTRGSAHDAGVSPIPSENAGPVAPQAAPGSDELTLGQMQEICEAVQEVRGDWYAPGIMAELRKVAHLSFSAVMPAMVEAAANRAMATPGHLADAARTYAVSRMTVEHEAEVRERGREDWRREAHEDVENRARPESRAEHLARLKAEAQAGSLRSPVRGAGRA